MDRPFQCVNCRNWYTPLPTDPNLMCRMCAEGLHAAHSKTGIIDCHWGQTSSTPSEIGMATVAFQAQAALEACKQATSAESLAKASSAVAQAEQANARVPELIRWAGVMEMPGKRDEAPEARYLGTDAIAGRVNIHRRPPEDLEMLKRSIRICGELGAEIQGLMAQARAALGAARQPVSTSVEATPKDTWTPERRKKASENLAHAREAKKAKQLVPAG